MKHVFIINGQAKEEYRNKLNLDIRHLFEHEDYIIEYTQYPRHATKIAREYATNYQDLRIYACGGDGTIHEIVNGIYPYTHVQLAILPIGTGNDFIKSFGYDREDFHQLQNYKDPVYLWSDLIRVGDEVSINTVSLGFDVKVAENVVKFKKKAGNKNAYYLSLLYCITQKLNTLFKMNIDGKRTPDKKYMFVVVCNGNYYGGGYKPCPMASISDGYLDLCLIFNVPRYRILDLSNAYKKGIHLKYKQYVKTQKIKQLSILNEEPIKVCLDGEIRTMTKPFIEVVPHQIQICLPKKVIK